MLGLTRHAKGFDTIELRAGVWLACDLPAKGPCVTAARPCEPPGDVPTLGEESLESVRKASAEERTDEALRSTPTVHRVAPVNEAPLARLVDWQISELNVNGSRHVWGYDLMTREGRASSMLAEFDPATASLISATGRRYELVSRPGFDADAEFVWRTSLTTRGFTTADAHSITADVWKAIQEHRNSIPPSA
ncbi:hypothetical protein GCM10027034_37480 [Ramlibacter solisilvae]